MQTNLTPFENRLCVSIAAMMLAKFSSEFVPQLGIHRDLGRQRTRPAHLNAWQIFGTYRFVRCLRWKTPNRGVGTPNSRAQLRTS